MKKKYVLGQILGVFFGSLKFNGIDGLQWVIIQFGEEETG